MRRAECDLFYFWEVFVDSAIKDELANDLERDFLLRPDFRSIKDVEFELVLTRLGDRLNRKLPFRKRAILDCLLKILAMEVL